MRESGEYEFYGNKFINWETSEKKKTRCTNSMHAFSLFDYAISQQRNLKWE